MSKGFTLIELLVVIAIIGILASVVLVSFPTATKTAKDSRIVSAASQMRTTMTEMYGAEGNYSYFEGACINSASPYYNEIKPLCDEITKNGGTNLTLKGTTDKACVAVQLTSKSSYYYCADSTGKAGYTTTSPITNCSSNYLCPEGLQ